MTKYETSGPVRGSCGHKHRSIRTAIRCLLRDARDCKRAGGYSDRKVRREDGEEFCLREVLEYNRVWKIEMGMMK